MGALPSSATARTVHKALTASSNGIENRVPDPMSPYNFLMIGGAGVSGDLLS